MYRVVSRNTINTSHRLSKKTTLQCKLSSPTIRGPSYYYSTTSSGTAKSSSSFLFYSTVSLLSISSVYFGCAYYATIDDNFNQNYWSLTPYGNEARDIVKKISSTNIQDTVKDGALSIGKQVDSISTSVKDNVNTITTGVDGVSKSVQSNISHLNDYVEGVSNSIGEAKEVVTTALDTVWGKVSPPADSNNNTTPPPQVVVKPKVESSSRKEEEKPTLEKPSLDESNDKIVKQTDVDLESKTTIAPVVAEKENKTKDASSSLTAEESTIVLPNAEETEVETLEAVVTDFAESPSEPEDIKVDSTDGSLRYSRASDDLVQSSLSILGESLNNLPANSTAHQLATLLHSLVVALEDISTKDDTLSPKIKDASSLLVEASNKLNQLEVEESEMITKTLKEQNKLFEDFLHMVLTQHERDLEKLNADLTTQWNGKLAAEHDRLTAEHKAELVDVLGQQASMLSEQLEHSLSEQHDSLTTSWEKEVKKRVDQERDARLARLDHLTLKLLQLERINMQVAESVERSEQVRQMWVCLRGLQDILSLPHATPFKAHLAQLKTLSEKHPYPLVKYLCSTISLDDAEAGVPTFQELRDRFNYVSDHLVKAQFVPPNGGPISYLASDIFSRFMFRKVGLVPGQDLESILSRARFYLESGDVDSCAREINQLSGMQKSIARDWMRIARKYLETRQIVEVVESHLELMDLGLI